MSHQSDILGLAIITSPTSTNMIGITATSHGQIATSKGALYTLEKVFSFWLKNGHLCSSVKCEEVYIDIGLIVSFSGVHFVLSCDEDFL